MNLNDQSHNQANGEWNQYQEGYPGQNHPQNGHDDLPFETMQGGQWQNGPQADAPYSQGQGGQNPYQNVPPYQPQQGAGPQNPYGQQGYPQGQAYGQAQGYGPQGQVPYGQNPYGQNPYGQPAYGQTPYGGSRRPRATNQAFQQLGTDLKQVLAAYASSQPVQAFKFDLSDITWILLIVFNILIYGLNAATAQYMLVKKLGTSFNDIGDLGDLGSVFSEALESSVGKIPWGAPFGYGLLKQSLILLALIGMGFLMVNLMKGEKRPALQYVKTVATATIPHTILHFVLLFLGILLPQFALAFSSISLGLLLFTYYVGFSKLHPSKRSYYWLYVATIFVVGLLHHYLP